MTKFLIVYTDGACRGNHQMDKTIVRSAVGYHYIGEDGTRFGSGKVVDAKTNVEAEYCAIIEALKCILEHYKPVATHGSKNFDITLKSDSETALRHLKGLYRVRKQSLKPFFNTVKELEEKFGKVTYEFIHREENTFADALANKYLDEV